MSMTIAFLILLIIGLLIFYKLTNTALNRRANVRAGARLGPGSFFFEVKDQEADDRPNKE